MPCLSFKYLPDMCVMSLLDRDKERVGVGNIMLVKRKITPDVMHGLLTLGHRAYFSPAGL